MPAKSKDKNYGFLAAYMSWGVELKVPQSGETPHSYHLGDEGSGVGPLRATLHI